MTSAVIAIVGFGILTAVAIMAGAAADTLRQRNIRIERQLDLIVHPPTHDPCPLCELARQGHRSLGPHRQDVP